MMKKDRLGQKMRLREKMSVVIMIIVATITNNSDYRANVDFRLSLTLLIVGVATGVISLTELWRRVDISPKRD